MKTSEIKEILKSEAFSQWMSRLYGKTKSRAEAARWSALGSGAVSTFGAGDWRLFSAPGRTELGGNHTDHNRGCVLAAAVHMDTIAFARPRDDMKAVVHAEGYEAFEISLSDTEIKEREKSTSAALVRGIAHYFLSRGAKVGGFSAQVGSTVLKGSGLSSSAAFEILIAGIFNALYNGGKKDPVFMALAGQYAENEFFGKPCGLMDQAASAVGGVIGIDFKASVHPIIRKLAFSPEKEGYTLAVVDTGGNHADLTDDYASIPAEMRSVASVFGKTELRDVKKTEFVKRIADLRQSLGDRTVLRALHFLEESPRAAAQFEALDRGDFAAFLDLVRASGASSFTRLQNIWPSSGDGREQGIALALALSEDFLAGDGASRVHGGGFAGTIQAWVPVARYKAYNKAMEAVFGAGSVSELSLRADGFVELALNSSENAG